MVKKAFYVIAGLLILVVTILFVCNSRYSFYSTQGKGWSIGYATLEHPMEKWRPDPTGIINFEWLNKQTWQSTRFLADPFVVFENGEYYIFFEHQAEGNANIALLRSPDGKDFTYAGEILDEEFHLSFPQVFKHKNEFYMLPETRQAGHVLLYRAENFPFNWKIHDTLIKNVKLQDPAILISDSIYLISGREENLTQFVYTADSLEGQWEQDVRFKLRRGDETRAAGNFFRIDQRWFIPFQENNEGYGTGVSLYELVVEEDNIKFEKRIDAYLAKSNSIQWFNKGMHHLSTIKTPDNYYSVFDGEMEDPAKPKLPSWKASLKYNYYDVINFFNRKFSE